MVPAVSAAEEGLSPSPIRWVLAGKIHDLGMRMVPAGKRIVDGGGLVIPAHGLAVHCMLVVVVPGRPRASMTAPADGMIPFEGFRTQFSTAQKFLLGGLLKNTLASMKAPEDPQLLDEEHVACEL